MRTRLLAIAIAATGLAVAGPVAVASAYTTDGLQFYIDSRNTDSFDVSDPTHWNDVSPSQLQGELINVEPDSTTGSMQFIADGCSASYVDFGSTNLDYSQGITVEFVADLASAEFFERIIDFGDGLETNNIVVSRYETSNNLVIEIWHDGSPYERFITWSDPLATSGPLHFAVTVDADRNADWYVNGEEVQTYLAGSITTGGQVYGGLPPVEPRAHSYVGRSHWCDPGLDGQIEFIRIYGRGLAADEVLDNYTYDDSTAEQRDAASQSGAADSLASTGFDAALFAGTGVAALGAGVALRRRTRSSH